MSESTRKNLAKIQFEYDLEKDVRDTFKRGHHSAAPDTIQLAHDPAPVVYFGSESARARYVSDRRRATVPNGDQTGTILAYLAELNTVCSGSDTTSKDLVYRHSTSARSTLSGYIASRYYRYS